METPAPAPAVEKKEAKSGLLEDSSFPDPGKKACPLAVAAAAAAAAAVAAQGGTLSVLHAWRAAGVCFTRSLGFNECAGPCHAGFMEGSAPTPGIPGPKKVSCSLLRRAGNLRLWQLGPEQGEEKGGTTGQLPGCLGCVQLAPGGVS